MKFMIKIDIWLLNLLFQKNDDYFSFLNFNDDLVKIND